MKGLVLAAGTGTRLFPLSLFRAKPAMPFLNRPIIQYSIDLLRGAGIPEIAVNLHHLPDSVRRAVGEEQPGVLFSYEPEILGTGGAIARLRDFLDDGDDFVVCNGKIYLEQRLAAPLAFHRENRALVTLVLSPENEEFNPVFVGADSRVRGFGRRHVPKADEDRFAFTGVHILAPEVLARFPEGPSDSVRDVYVPMIESGRPVHAYISRAFWREISTPLRYLRSSMELLGHWGLRNSTSGRLEGEGVGVVAGSGFSVDPTARLRNGVFWENVSIGAGATLNNVIVTDNITVPAQRQFSNVMLTRLPEGGPELERGGRRQGDMLVWPLV